MTACTNPDTITRLDSSTITTEALTDSIQHLVDAADVTGMAVTVFNDHQVAYQRSFGLANADTGDSLRTDHLFYGASLSKAVFGYIVAQLVVEGQIDLDTPLHTYLDQPITEVPFEKDWRGWGDLKGDPRVNEITARMCLNHTTGFPNWRWITKDLQIDGEYPLTFFFDPGERYSYSGEGMQLLQYVVEHITGKGLEELARGRVFKPFGMANTSYLWQEEFEGTYCFGHTSDQQVIPKDKNDEAGAAGSMETTPEDYSRFLTAVLQQAEEGSPVIDSLFQPSVRIRSKAQFGPLAYEDTTAHDDIALSYGMGWGILQTPNGFGAFKEGHSEGFQHYSILFPETGRGILLMSNSDNGESIFRDLLRIGIGDTYTPWRWENWMSILRIDGD